MSVFGGKADVTTGVYKNRCGLLQSGYTSKRSMTAKTFSILYSFHPVDTQGREGSVAAAAALITAAHKRVCTQHQQFHRRLLH